MLAHETRPVSKNKYILLMRRSLYHVKHALRDVTLRAKKLRLIDRLIARLRHI